MNYRSSLFRSRPLTRAVVAAGSGLLVLLGVRLLWGMEASSRVAATEKQIAAYGLKRTPALEVQDNQNAAVALLDALQTRHVDGLDFGMREGRGVGFVRGFFWSPGDTSRLKGLLAANADAFQKLDKVAALSQARWTVPPDEERGDLRDESPIVAAIELRMILRIAAENAHGEGDDLTALRHLERILTIGRVFSAGPTLSSQTIADTAVSEVAQMLDRWSTTIQLQGQTADLARRLVRRLGDTLDAGHIASSFEYETVTSPQSLFQQVPGLQAWWLRPLALDAASRRVVAQLELMPIVRATNWQALADLHLPPIRPSNNLNSMVFGLSAPSFNVNEVMRYHFRALTDARAAALLIAADLHHADHGKLPTSMEQLIPAYLSETPVDSFADDARPMRYRLDKGGPTVWSVGENGKDDQAVPDASMGPGGIGPASAAGIPTTAPSSTAGAGGRFRGTRGMGMGMGMRMGGGLGFGFGFGSGRRYFQPDIVYGAAWREWMASWGPGPGR